MSIVRESEIVSCRYCQRAGAPSPIFADLCRICGQSRVFVKRILERHFLPLVPMLARPFIAQWEDTVLKLAVVIYLNGFVGALECPDHKGHTAHECRAASCDCVCNDV